MNFKATYIILLNIIAINNILIKQVYVSVNYHTIEKQLLMSITFELLYVHI